MIYIVIEAVIFILITLVIQWAMDDDRKMHDKEDDKDED